MIKEAQGSWYLGRQTGEEHEAVEYRSDRLTTHGVIVGMTGSGKTGLGIIALEEALLDDIPCLVIDPKGDMGNLLLNFPEFATEDFLPWIDEGQAKREGVEPEELAESTAAQWKAGLEGYGIGPDRLRRLRSNAGFSIYTPGSTAGIPLNVLGSLAAPQLDWDTEAETGRDEIEGYVSSLLVLAGITADPISSPEHILLATLIERAWRAGKDLDLANVARAGSESAHTEVGSFRTRQFLCPQGPHQVGYAAQRTARLSVVRIMDAGPTPRHRQPPLYK